MITNLSCIYYPVYSQRPSLADYSDEEIAREYHWRMLQKLGDPRVGVTVPYDIVVFHETVGQS